MSEIQFETDQVQYDSPRGVQFQKKPFSLASWLVKMGFIRDESSAKGVLVGIIILNLILTGLVIYFFVL